jgi:zinc protease
VTIEPNPLKPAENARETMAKTLGKPVQPPAVEADDTARGPMPKGAAEPKFSLPTIQRSRLSNGMEVLLVENHGLPLVNLHAVFMAGRGLDPVDKPGLAELMSAAWDEGTQKRSAEDIASELAGIGASLSLGTDADTSSVRLFTLKRHLAKALDVYADVLRNPVFPDAEVNRQRLMALGRLTQVRNEPVALGSMAASQLLYGAEHPYGHPQLGNAESLRRITSDDLRKCYARCARPERSGMIAVGDITMAELKAELERVLSGWKSASADAAAENFPPAPEAKPTSVVLVDKAGAAQSVILVALVGADRKSPDYFPLTVMNMVFGGQFSSRLNMNLRENKGYTYGARSTFEWRVRQPGPFAAMASVQTAVTGPALVEFLKELEGMTGGRPVEAKELDFCQKYITRGYTAGFETPSQVATQLETLFAHKLPDDYFNTVVPNTNAVSGSDVARVAKKYFKLDRLVIVVVGDRKVVEPELRKLPVGKDLSIMQFNDEFRLVPAKE